MKNPKINTDVDKVLKELYDSGTEWNDRLAVAKLMVEIEKARIKQSDEGSDGVPLGLAD